MKKNETNSERKNVSRQLLFLEIVSVMKNQDKLFMYVYKVLMGVDLIKELLRKLGREWGGGMNNIHSFLNTEFQFTILKKIPFSVNFFEFSHNISDGFFYILIYLSIFKKKFFMSGVWWGWARSWTWCTRRWTRTWRAGGIRQTTSRCRSSCTFSFTRGNVFILTM